MIDIFLYIVIGSVAGVFTFVSCMLIWNIDLKKATPEITVQQEEHQESATAQNQKSFYTPLENEMRFSIPVSHEEISLTNDNDFVSGSFIDMERKVDGIQTYQRFFLN